MTNKTILSDEEIRKIADAFFTKDDDQDEGLCFARDIEQAVLQSPEIQQLRNENTAMKEAICDFLKLKEKIRTFGRPPHSDFWHQSVYEAEEKLRAAMEVKP